MFNNKEREELIRLGVKMQSVEKTLEQLREDRLEADRRWEAEKKEAARLREETRKEMEELKRAVLSLTKAAQIIVVSAGVLAAIATFSFYSWQMWIHFEAERIEELRSR